MGHVDTLPPIMVPVSRTFSIKWPTICMPALCCLGPVQPLQRCTRTDFGPTVRPFLVPSGPPWRPFGACEPSKHPKKASKRAKNTLAGTSSVLGHFWGNLFLPRFEPVFDPFPVGTQWPKQPKP